MDRDFPLDKKIENLRSYRIGVGRTPAVEYTRNTLEKNLVEMATAISKDIYRTVSKTCDIKFEDVFHEVYKTLNIINETYKFRSEIPEYILYALDEKTLLNDKAREMLYLYRYLLHKIEQLCLDKSQQK